MRVGKLHWLSHKKIEIVIYLYSDDHNPPHFHASYEGLEAMFGLNGNLLKGYISQRAQNLSKNGVIFTRMSLKKIGNYQNKIDHLTG